MDISGLVFRNDHSASSSPASRAGVMAPHMPMEGQPYVSDHMGNQMGNFNPYGGGQYGFDSQVQQYQVVSHSQPGYGPQAFPPPPPPPQQPHPHHHHNPHQPPPQALATHRISPQTIPRDTGQLGRNPNSLRMPLQKTPALTSQPPGYTFHPAPQHPPQMSPQQQQQRPLLHLHQQPPAHQTPQRPQSVPLPQQQQQQQQQQHSSRQQQQQEQQAAQLRQQQEQQRQEQQRQQRQHQLQQQQAQQQQAQQQQQEQQRRLQQQHQQQPSPVQSSEPPMHPPKPQPKTDSISHLVGTTKVKSPDREVDFQTDVDNLMKAIQAKQPRKDEKPPSPEYRQPSKAETGQPIYPQAPTSFGGPYQNGYQQHAMGSPPQNHQSPTMDVNKMLTSSVAGSPLMSEKPQSKKTSPKPKKRYECTVAGCNKSFFQRTHLDIHSRAHTGDKPFECSESGCGQRFSQLGNLKTHERRHTGEKPYSCDFCGKRFAQRGNVRAHKIVHDGAKPFTCKLDNCLKQFTQLGNLKSHQNKFHATALRQLTERFAAIRNPDEISPIDRDLFEYFAELYKNSNRGIKGRGKDRKISGVKKSRTGDSGSAKRGQDLPIASPNASSTTSNGEPNYDFAANNASHMEEDDESGDAQYDQQQLPPLRPGNEMGPPSIGMMYGESPMGMHPHIAKYRKFQV